MSTGINENVIRWSVIRLPHPSKSGEFLDWKVDGPFALRRHYRVEGTSEIIELDLSHRQADGRIAACLVCGGAPLEKTTDRPWTPILIWAVLGLGLAPFTFGISALIAAYPLWFLWFGSPVTQTCTSCTAEFVDFRFGPRP